MSKAGAILDILEVHFGEGTQQGRKGDLSAYPVLRKPPHARDSANQFIECVTIPSRNCLSQGDQRHNPEVERLTVQFEELLGVGCRKGSLQIWNYKV